ncbi:GGDEF domain-containing protein [Pseudoalteromonas sp. NEC-BIFX-2020_002]|uniref:diguanylate cyclase n=2 Tax=Pseudoalteromonas TaxID=53246 RepID=UPI0009E8E481
MLKMAVMDTFDLDYTLRLRLKVIRGMTSVTLLLALGLGLLNIFIGQHFIYGGMQCLYAFFSLGLYLNASKTDSLHWSKQLYVYSLVGLIASGAHMAPLVSYLLMWALALPIVFYLLLGKRFGIVLSGFYFVAQITIIYFKTETFYTSPLLNFAFSYLLVWGISHTYETSRANSEKALRTLALKDPLTGAFNRLSLTKTYSQLNKSQPVSLALLDIDYFKNVNDSYGHPFGDEVLKKIAQGLTSATNRNSVFRIGGEEFCILMENVTPELAVIKAEEIRSKVAAEYVTHGKDNIHVTVSIGVSTSTDSSLSELLKAADVNLYLAKEKGRNCVVYK